MTQAVLAQSPEDKRRVEEEKRLDLKSSEFYLPEAEIGEIPQAEQEDNAPNAFFKGLISKDVATLADAYRVLTLLLGVDDRYPTTGARYEFLLEQKIAHPVIGTASEFDKPLTKGAAAYMLVRAMNIKGGFILRVFGTTQRYAFKELMYQNIMYPGIVHDVMSGQELILTLTHAADYMAGKKKETR